MVRGGDRKLFNLEASTPDATEVVAVFSSQVFLNYYFGRNPCAASSYLLGGVIVKCFSVMKGRNAIVLIAPSKSMAHLFCEPHPDRNHRFNVPNRLRLEQVVYVLEI